MRAHIFAASGEGTPDGLIFSNRHADRDDWLRDIQRVMERYRIREVRIASDLS